MTWSPTQDTKRYRPRDARDATPAVFAERLAACAGCPRRFLNRCQSAETLVSVAARPAKAACPLGLWSGPAASVESGALRVAGPDNNSPPTTNQPPPQNLAIVTCHFNPCGYRRPIKNYRRFVAGLGDLADRLYTVELAFDDEPFQIVSDTDAARHFGYRVDSRLGTMWQKERLLNLGFSQLPASVDAVAWIDADLLFLNPDWAAQTLHALESHSAVQLFGGVIDTDATGEAIEAPRPGIGKVNRVTSLAGKYGRPGGAWAVRRDVLPNGIYDRHILGGGDSILAHSWLGRVEKSQSFAGLDSRILREFAASQANIPGGIGYVPGDVIHLYHGTRANRRYVDRYQILRDGGFDPVADLRDDPAAPLQWSDEAIRNKSEMVEAVRRYFVDRQEDT